MSNVQSKVDHRLSPDIAQRLHNGLDRTSTSAITVATATRSIASRKQQQRDKTGSSNRGAAA